jgi:lipopolysaccharide transport system permease protein
MNQKMSLLSNKYLILELIKIEFTQNYKRSFIGIGWMLFLPILQSIVWIFLQKSGLLNPGELKVNYIAYVLIGTLLWQLYNQSYDVLGNCINTSIKTFTQGFIPVFYIVTAKYTLILARFFISGAINIFLIYLFSEASLNIPLFLLSIIPFMLFCFTMGVFMSMIEVVNTDVYILGKEFNKFLLFLTPIIYSPKFDSTIIQNIIEYNPLSYFISIPRDLLLSNPNNFSMNIFYVLTGIVIVLFIVNLFVYNKRVSILIEKLIE